MRVTMPTLVLDLESSSMCCNLPLVEWLLSQWGILKHFPQSICIFISHWWREKWQSSIIIWLKSLIFIALMVSLAMSAASVRFSNYAENLFWHGRPRPIRHAVCVIRHLQKCFRFWRISAVSLNFFAICEEIRKLPSSSQSAEKELWQKKMENRWWEITNVDWGRAKIGWHSNHHFFLPKKISFETCPL